MNVCGIFITYFTNLKCVGLKSDQKLHVQVLKIEHKVLHVFIMSGCV